MNFRHLTAHALMRVKFLLLCVPTHTDDFRTLERLEVYLTKRMNRRSR
jgi:hypothetical protein